MEENIVFVYGSLKQGYGLHRVIEYCDYLGEGTVGPQYTLLDSIHFPYLVERPGDGAKGETYKVSNIILDQLDRIEGHPRFYQRKKTIVKLENGEELEAFVYIHPDNYYVSHLKETFEWVK